MSSAPRTASATTAAAATNHSNSPRASHSDDRWRWVAAAAMCRYVFYSLVLGRQQIGNRESYPEMDAVFMRSATSVQFRPQRSTSLYSQLCYHLVYRPFLGGIPSRHGFRVDIAANFISFDRFPQSENHPKCGCFCVHRAQASSSGAAATSIRCVSADCTA